MKRLPIKITPLLITESDFTERYGLVCDALCRSLWAKEYGIKSGDNILHTSNKARQLATMVFQAAGIESIEETKLGDFAMMDH